jgi:uncharacterized cupin superfamily protein
MGPMSTFAGDSGPRCIDPGALTLTWEPVDPAKAISGRPVVGAAELASAHGVEVGVWAHTAGVSTDVEVDEVFVVLSGRATIECGDGTVLEVGPGDVGILPPGTTTRWTVHEDLRKVYVIGTQP